MEADTATIYAANDSDPYDRDDVYWATLINTEQPSAMSQVDVCPEMFISVVQGGLKKQKETLWHYFTHYTGCYD